MAKPLFINKFLLSPLHFFKTLFIVMCTEFVSTFFCFRDDVMVLEHHGHFANPFLITNSTDEAYVLGDLTQS